MIEPTVKRSYSPRMSDEDLLRYADQGHDLKALTYSRRARLSVLQAIRDGLREPRVEGEVPVIVCGKEFARRPNKRHHYCSDQACFRMNESRRVRSHSMGPRLPPKPLPPRATEMVTCTYCCGAYERATGVPVGRYGLCCPALECQRMRQALRMRDYSAAKRAQGINIFAPYRAKSAAKMKAKIAAGEMKPWRQRYPEKARRLDALRRARKLGALVGEKFHNEEIYERDGWICGICDEPVDPVLAWPDTQSATLDHVIPISRGGTHSSDNVQLAHYGCNSRKGDKIPAA